MLTAQVLVDSTQETAESNEGNNSRTLSVNVSGSCAAPPPPPPSTAGNPAGCDVAATFTAPSGPTVPVAQPFTYQVAFTNKGTATCGAFKAKISRYNNKTCSGCGWQWEARAPGRRSGVSPPGRPNRLDQ